MATMLQEHLFALSNLKVLLQPDQTFTNNKFKERLCLLPITNSLSNVKSYRLRQRTRLISWTCASRTLHLLTHQSLIVRTQSISFNKLSCSITDRWTKGTTEVKDKDLILILGKTNQWMVVNILQETNLLHPMFNQSQLNSKTQCLLHRSSLTQWQVTQDLWQTQIPLSMPTTRKVSPIFQLLCPRTLTWSSLWVSSSMSMLKSSLVKRKLPRLLACSLIFPFRKLRTIFMISTSSLRRCTRQLPY